ncbi:hypothetical protein OK074_8539 [Actinobacteria bacterium OK074]|nr:hypothetical protein OK074_8539 [Actinobacteria bacterium OK074]
MPVRMRERRFESSNKRSLAPPAGIRNPAHPLLPHPKPHPPHEPESTPYSSPGAPMAEPVKKVCKVDVGLPMWLSRPMTLS